MRLGTYLTGFADEAADDLPGQIRALKALGWNRLEARSVDGINIHDLSDERFEEACRLLAEVGVEVNCFGSTIANWSKSVAEPFDDTLATVGRAVARMKRLGTKLVRVMSYAVIRDPDGRAAEDQLEGERFRRLREIVRRFADEGMRPVHENCMNYGGMDAAHTLRMLEEVPGLELVFDTGNPPLTPDFGKPFPYPMQSSWDFYQAVKERVAYVHVKDSRWEPIRQEELYAYPGDGDGEVARIVADLLKSGYSGGFSIEPHMAVVFHDGAVRSPESARFDNFVEYGRRFEALLASLEKSSGQRPAS